MEIKKKLSILFLLAIPFFVFGQNDMNEIIRAGIELHDAGKYEEAINKYKEGLEIDKNSSLVNYELALSYFHLKEYKKSIKCSNKVLKNDEKYLKEAYLTKGSCLDNLGNPESAIETYEEAIKKFPEDYLLYFNLALTQYNNNDLRNAEENLINGITLNPTHPTSNYLLGIIKFDQGRKIESLLAIHFFLLIEPNTQRSEEALKLLKQVMGAGVKRKDDKNVEININSLGLEDEFSTASLMLSLQSAANMAEEKRNKSEQELFYENTESIFKMLSELKKDKIGIWWDLYIDFYSRLIDSENIEAYCYYISQMNGDVETKWIEKNKESMNKFYDWISE